MDRKEKKLLWDIQQSILAIDEHLEGERNQEVYLKNKTMRRAVERELEIIGEAVSKLLKLNPTVEISDARSIVGQRNLLIHGYDGVDDERVWKVVVEHLPLLKTEVDTLLSS